MSEQLSLETAVQRGGFYMGSSADGSDIQEVPGMYVSPNGKYWGSEPITLSKEKEMDKEFFDLYRPRTRRERREIERRNNGK